MLVTAIVPLIGYDNATKIAQMAIKNQSTLRDEAISSGFVNEEEFEKYIRPEEMTFPK